MSIPASATVLVLAAIAVSFLVADPEAALADELSSTSYRHRAGTFSSSAAAGSEALTSSAGAPVYGSSDTTVGAAPTAGPVGSLGTLRSILPGFWPIVVGALPNLDLDGDFAQFFLDEDDDGDGIDDIHETGTGYFVSALNTGTSPTRVDSDADGFDDGLEVASGSDPNDPLSLPTMAPVPGLGAPFQIVLFAILIALAYRYSEESFLSKRSPSC